MSDKRLLSKSLIFGTEMSKMSTKARLLYIAIVMDADDWGIVDVDGPLRYADATFSELNELVDAGFIFYTRIPNFFLVRHWFSQNLIPPNRRTASLHPEILADFSYNLEKGTPDKNYHMKNPVRKAEPVEPEPDEVTEEEMASNLAFMQKIGMSFQ